MKRQNFLYLLCICVVLSSCSSSRVKIGGHEFELQIDEQATQSCLEQYRTHDDSHEENYSTSLADLSNYQYGEKMIAAPGLAPETKVKKLDTLPYEEYFGYDVSDSDVSAVDLSPVTDYNMLSFSTNTRWPAKLPESFDPDELLEYNKNPGLGLRALHGKGITGEGVGVAIIDMTLFLDHEEYRDRLMYYEEIHLNPNWVGDRLHGAAVSSIAVGESVGVAPGAKLYFIGGCVGHYVMDGEQFVDFEYDWSIQAQAVDRIIELNRRLPESDKIRVISISNSAGLPGEKGHEEMIAAIERADKENIFVMCDIGSAYYQFDINIVGMTRDYRDDPDNFNSYRPAKFWEDNYYSNYAENAKKSICIPVDSHTFAWYSGADSYMLSSFGGGSWLPPWLAGLYALCCQAKPDITPQEFVRVLVDTGESVDSLYYGKTVPFGRIVNPEAVIRELMEQ